MHERTEGDLVMHIMLAAVLGRAADLAAESIPRPDRQTDARPIGTVIVRVVGPGSAEAQSLDHRLRKRKPVACGLQVGGRQVERFFAEILPGEPAQFLETNDLGCDLDLAPAFFADLICQLPLTRSAWNEDESGLCADTDRIWTSVSRCGSV